MVPLPNLSSEIGLETLGRLNFQLPDVRTISRQHVELTRNGDVLHVRALHRNAIRLWAVGDPEGKLLSRAASSKAHLHPGDLLEVGDVCDVSDHRTWTYRLVSTPSPAATPVTRTTNPTNSRLSAPPSAQPPESVARTIGFASPLAVPAAAATQVASTPRPFAVPQAPVRVAAAMAAMATAPDPAAAPAESQPPAESAEPFVAVPAEEARPEPPVCEEQPELQALGSPMEEPVASDGAGSVECEQAESPTWPAAEEEGSRDEPATQTDTLYCRLQSLREEEEEEGACTQAPPPGDHPVEADPQEEEAEPPEPPEPAAVCSKRERGADDTTPSDQAAPLPVVEVTGALFGCSDIPPAKRACSSGASPFAAPLSFSMTGSAD